MKVPPKPHDEATRLRVLRQYDILDTLPEPDFDDIVFLASQICQTPIALVSLIDEHRQWFKAKRGLAASETPRDIAFCAHAILQPSTMVVPDSSADERFHDNPLAVGEPFVRFYAGAPLKGPEGQNIGTLCVIDHSPRQLSQEQILALEALSRQLVNQLEFRIKSESIRRAAKLLQCCPAAIFCKDYESGKGVFVEWNDAAEDLWNLKKDQVLGRSDSDIFDLEQAAHSRTSDLKSLQSGQQVYVERESIETSKGRKELRTWKVPVIDSKGKPRFVLGISFDITQQIQIEMQLHDARIKAETAAQNLDLALEGASLGIWDWDLRTNEVSFDRRWCEMLGLAVEDTKMELKTWEERVHPDDLALCYKAIQAYVSGEKGRYENVHRMRHVNGEWIHILDRGRISAWDQDGKTQRFTGTHLDISYIERSKEELQEARRRLEDAELAGNFGSWKLDLITGESTWSRGHNHIFDFDSERSKPSFEAFIGVLDPQERSRLQDLFQNLQTGKISSFETDYRILTKSGSARYVKANGQLIFDEKKRPLAIIGTVQDITRLKLMELSLIESRELAIAATKTKSRFLANMSHEIRTPLNGVIGSTVLLMETDLTKEQRELADTIKNSSDSLLALIDDILDFSKIEAGKLDIEMLPFDPAATIRDAVKIISNRAVEKQITLLVEVDERVPKVIVSDPLRFRQILLNLLSNAVKFTDYGQVRIAAKHTMLDESQLKLVVTVQDSGIGMSPEQQQKLFQDFTQVDGSTTRKYGGSGLGLAICKQLCGLLGGSIAVASELGKGTTFTFQIAAALGQSLQVGELPQAKSVNSEDLPPLRVLVAEDNRTNQEIIVQFLKKVNLNADLVDNGRAAVSAVKSGSYDIVFMDVNMPIMDGYDATKEIRKTLPLERQPYILALTANAMKEDKDLSLAAGMDDFLIKPLGLRELKVALSKFASLRQGPRQDEIEIVQAFNPQSVLARFQDDWELFQHASGLFLQECDQDIVKIQAAFDQQDARTLQKALHTLKGAASYFSSTMVTPVAAEMEDLVKKGKLEESRLLFPRLQTEGQQLRAEITRFLDEKKSA